MEVAEDQHITADKIAQEKWSQKRLVQSQEQAHEVLLSLVDGLKQQRQDAEQRARRAEEQTKLYETRLVGKNEEAAVCKKSPPQRVESKSQEAKKIDRQRAIRQNKIDDRHRR